MILRLTILLGLGTMLLYLTGCTTGYLPPYFAHIDKVEPVIPGLIIKESRGGGGELDIINNTGKEVYLFDEHGQEYVKITSSAIYWKRDGEWRPERNSNVHYCLDPRLRYLGPEPKECKKQTVKYWSIEGRVEDKRFTITGRTVYEPPPLVIEWLRRVFPWWQGN